jgi:hypothetical protein
MWSRIHVGRPIVLALCPWFNVPNPQLQPTVAYLWDRVKVPFTRPMWAYVEYANELDTLTPSMVSPLHFILLPLTVALHFVIISLCLTTITVTFNASQVTWELYNDIRVVQLQLSNMSFADDDLYWMMCSLICFYAVEYQLPHRVARHFGLRQKWPVLSVSNLQAHRGIPPRW